jgi:hypothetical protein
MQGAQGSPPSGVAAVGSSPGTYVGEPRVSGARRGTLWRDLGLGAAAALALAALIAGAYLLGTRVLGGGGDEPPPAPGAGTLVVALAGGGDGEVFLDGERKGTVRAGEALTLEGLAPGPVEVRVKRPGVPDCVQREALDAEITKVVSCRFATVGGATGTLMLDVLTEGATVYLDKQEISPQAAREPLIVAADEPHEVVVKKDGYVTRTLRLTVKPGEGLAQRVELEPVPPPRERPSRPREPEPEPGAPAPAPAVPAEEPPPAPAAAATDEEPGYLIAETTPWARILIDGKDTGRMTPVAPRAKIAVTPGKHKVTFVVGDKSFGYTIMVAPGEDYVLKRELPVD